MSTSALYSFHSPCIVAGPCAAESREQILICAEALASDSRISFLRAGVWKPRTRPGGFEGIGEPALQWLALAQQKYGIRVCVEVATPDHVRAAQMAGITSFWLGARTTSDPFAVEAVVRALQPGDGPIFVKNPISPDLDLWIGAIERLRRMGHSQVIAVLRGFYPRSPGRYRNTPHWDVALTLRTRMSDIPILCDPSHIAGKREEVPFVARRAYDFSLDGLFVEVHPSPDDALSDARQQLTPAAFFAMLDALPLSPVPSILPPDEELLELRAMIDSIDNQILDLIAERMSTVEQIGRWKMAHNQLPFQRVRWRSLLFHHLRYGRLLGLDVRFVRNLCELVHTESLRIQGMQRGENRELED